MENELKKALEANNLPKIRELLVEIIRNDSGKTAPIQTVTEVLETTPGLFDDDNGKKYAAPDKMTPELTMELIQDLKSNFSLEKFKLLTETCALRVDNPDSMVAEAYVEDQAVKEKVSDVKEDTDSAGKESCGGKKKCSCGKVTGAVIMALGCAAAIVGLCLPGIKFLLGLGIGVFMLGTAFVYLNIKN